MLEHDNWSSNSACSLLPLPSRNDGRLQEEVREERNSDQLWTWPLTFMDRLKMNSINASLTGVCLHHSCLHGFASGVLHNYRIDVRFVCGAAMPAAQMTSEWKSEVIAWQRVNKPLLVRLVRPWRRVMTPELWVWRTWKPHISFVPDHRHTTTEVTLEHPSIHSFIVRPLVDDDVWTSGCYLFTTRSLSGSVTVNLWSCWAKGNIAWTAPAVNRRWCRIECSVLLCWPSLLGAVISYRTEWLTLVTYQQHHCFGLPPVIGQVHD